MKRDEALGLLAEAIIDYYKQKCKSSDAFESYVYGLCLKLAIAPVFFRSRFIRGYRVIHKGLLKKKRRKSKMDDKDE